MPCRVRPVAALALALSCELLAASAAAAEPLPGEVVTRTVRWQFGAESVRLPAAEDMGLVGSSVLFDVGGGLALGPAVYGAASGQRGGLFVGGLAVQQRAALAPRWSLVAEVYAGGGGGAAAPVGGGLMLRPALQLLRDFGGLEAGLSLSHVRFPSGEIRSTQWGLVLNWSGPFRVAAAPETPRAWPSFGSTGLGASRMALTLAQVDLRDGSGRRIGLPGARAEWHAEGDLAWGFETAGAASGGAAGYMEILGTAAWRVAPLPDVAPGLRLGARAALGLGGGGAVPTGGGVMGRLTALAEWHLAPWTLGVEAGPVAGRAASLRGRHQQVWLALDLDDAAGGPSTLARTEWTLALQRYNRAARADGTDGPLSTVGLKLTRQVGPMAYLTGQAHSAYAGGAGAFSIGLAGAGLMHAAGPHWRLGGEVLLGAAGGGGVQTGGGALAQALAWAGWKGEPGSGGPEWRVGLGGARSIRGQTRTPLIELSWAWAFGQTGP